MLDEALGSSKYTFLLLFTVRYRVQRTGYRMPTCMVIRSRVRNQADICNKIRNPEVVMLAVSALSQIRNTAWDSISATVLAVSVGVESIMYYCCCRVSERAYLLILVLHSSRV